MRKNSESIAQHLAPWWAAAIKNLIYLLLIIALMVAGSAAQAQQSGKIFRIGFLDSSTAAGSAILLETFRQELGKLGWIEGKNITIEYRFSENKGVGLLPELAANLARLNVDVIVATDTPSALAAKNATSGTPIVMANVGDPVVAGLVASLGAARRQRHRERKFNARAKQQKAGGTQRHRSQARASWTAAGSEKRRIRRSSIQRAQTCGCGTEGNRRGDQDSTGPQKSRERLSDRKAEACRRDYDAKHSPLFRPKKANRRAGR